MTTSDALQDSAENLKTPDGNDGPDHTAPDSETQSSAESADGGRTSDEGSRAPSDPAEGARDE